MCCSTATPPRFNLSSPAGSAYGAAVPAPESEGDANRGRGVMRRHSAGSAVVIVLVMAQPPRHPRPPP